MNRTELRSALTTAHAAAVWTAELLALTIALLLSLFADHAPAIGRTLGRWAGRAVRALRSEPVRQAVAAADYAARRFVTEQLGTAYPSTAYTLTPAVCLTAEAAPEVAAAPSRRDLLALAKAVGLPGYSRMTTAALAEALA